MRFFGFTLGRSGDDDKTPKRSANTIVYANGVEFRPAFFLDEQPKIVREYFAFGEMITEYTRLAKDDPSHIPTLIAACEGQIALADEHAKQCKREFRDHMVPACPGFYRLCLTLESLGRLDEALAVAQRAYRKQWEGQHQWPARIARLKKKIAKRDNKKPRRE